MKGASNRAESWFPFVVAPANSSKISVICANLNPSSDNANCDSVLKRGADFSRRSMLTLQNYVVASPHYESVVQ